MNTTKLFWLGLACAAGSGCSSFTTGNYFLSSDTVVAEARIKEPTKAPPYSASEAQDAVTLAAIRQFWADASQMTGIPVKEVYLGIGPDHLDPDVTLVSRVVNNGYRIHPLSEGLRPEVRTSLSGTAAEPDHRLALAIETLDLVDHYNAIVTGVWSLGSGNRRSISYRFRYASGRWSFVR